MNEAQTIEALNSLIPTKDGDLWRVMRQLEAAGITYKRSYHECVRDSIWTHPVMTAANADRNTNKNPLAHIFLDLFRRYDGAHVLMIGRCGNTRNYVLTGITATNPQREDKPCGK